MPSLPLRVLLAHRRLAGGAICGGMAILLLPATVSPLTRAIIGWDVGCLAFLGLAAAMFRGAGMPRIAADAAAQEEGEWTVFCLTIGAAVASFAAIVGQYSTVKTLPEGGRALHVGLLVLTLLLSWLMTHTLFALRYAHEYYTRSPGRSEVDGGLVLPGGAPPDYWDFLYFALVLGMTFQVSDVQITSPGLRRLATVHGFLSFLFNTVILALSVNIGANLL